MGRNSDIPILKVVTHRLKYLPQTLYIIAQHFSFKTDHLMAKLVEIKGVG